MKKKYNRPLFLYLMFLYMFFAYIFPDCAESVIFVNLNNKSTIVNNDILLKDIASFKGEDLELINKLKNIYICSSPLPGKTKIISRQHINLRLKQNDIPLDNISFNPQGSVKAERSSTVISKEKIKRIVRDYITKNLIHSDRKIIIKNIYVKKDVVLPEGNIVYQVAGLKNKKLSGIMNLPVIFEVNGGYKKKIFTRVDIECFSEVIVAKRPLPRNKIISIDDIDIVEMDVAKLPLNVIVSSEDIIGKRTKRKIDSKTVLRKDLVEFPPAVNRGDVVTIIAESVCLKISARGRIKKKGHIGEIVKVENMDSRKEIYAKVIDAYTVTVDF